MSRKRVLFSQAMDLLDDLLAAEATHQLHQRIDTLGRLDLLVVDKLGYLPMETDGPTSSSSWSTICIHAPR
jgi:DNA replication protein DnaC